MLRIPGPDCCDNRDNRTELSTALTVQISYRVLKPTTNPLRDAGWRVNKRKRRSNAGNNWTSTFISHSDKHGRHVYYSNPQSNKTIKAKHVFTITVKKHTQIYNRIMQLFSATLKQFYLNRLAPPTDIYTKPQKKKKSRLP